MAEVTQFAATTGEWPKNKDDYVLEKVIGAGSIAIVHEAYCKPLKEKCAIKRINLEVWSREIEELKQVEILTSLSHKYIIKYFTYFVVDEELWLVSRLLEGNSLLDVVNNYTLIENFKEGTFEEAIVATVLRKLLKGLLYLHSNGQCHRDIKAANVVLSEDGNIHLAGFGLSAWLAASDDSQEKSMLETQAWMAPELKETTNEYDVKADIWSFGITAIELATGKSTYKRHYQIEESMLATGIDDFIIEFVSAENFRYKKYGKLMREMVANCLETDPEKRPTAVDLLKHPLFKIAKTKKFLVRNLLPFTQPKEARVQRIIRENQLLEDSGWRYEKETEIWKWHSSVEETTWVEDV